MWGGTLVGSSHRLRKKQPVMTVQNCINVTIISCQGIPSWEMHVGLLLGVNIGRIEWTAGCEHSSH